MSVVIASFESIIAAVIDDSNDDLAVEDQFSHIAKDVAMAEPITNVLYQEVERILSAFGSESNNEVRATRDKEVETVFREGAAIRLEANDALRRYAGQMSKDELIEFQTVFSAKLDELLSTEIMRLVERRALAWAEQSECDPVTNLPN